MKKYIKSSESSSGRYIGGKLYDLPEEYWDNEDAQIDRYELMDKYVVDFANNYIVYQPDSYSQFSLWRDSNGLLAEVTDRMAIKDGIDLKSYPDHIEIVAYYNSRVDIAYLYPISNEKADELADIIDNSDFDESDTIESEIAQYAWGGASVEYILKSWA